MSYSLTDLSDLGIDVDTVDLSTALADPNVIATVARLVPEALVGEPQPTVAAQHWRNIILHAIVDAAYPASTFDYSSFAAIVRAAETE